MLTSERRRALAKKQLARNLALALPGARCEKFDIAHCACFWGRIFRQQFGDAPSGTNDPRWDALLHELRGLRLMNQLLERPPYWVKEPYSYV